MHSPWLTKHVMFQTPVHALRAQKSKQSDISQSLSLFSDILTALNTQNIPQHSWQVGWCKHKEHQEALAFTSFSCAIHIISNWNQFVCHPHVWTSVTQIYVKDWLTVAEEFQCFVSCFTNYILYATCQLYAWYSWRNVLWLFLVKGWYTG